MCLIMFMPMVMESIEEQLVQWYNRRTLLLELVEALGKYASPAHIEVFRLLWDDSPVASPLSLRCFHFSHTQPT